jgi:hypothetical protein
MSAILHLVDQGVDERVNVKIDFAEIRCKGMVCICLLAGSYKQGNGSFGWMKGEKCLNLATIGISRRILLLGVMQVGTVDLLHW